MAATQIGHGLLRRARLSGLHDVAALENAIHHHSEMLDHLSNEMMTIKISDINEGAKRVELWRLRSLAEYHRDVIDRLTDVVERISKRC